MAEQLNQFMSNVCFSSRLIAIVALGLLLCTPSLRAQPAGTSVSSVVVLLDGREFQVEKIELTAGKLRGKGIEGELSLDDVRQIRVRRDVDAPTAKAGIQVMLAGEGQVWATSLTIADDYCTATTADAGKLKLSIDVVRSIVFDAANLPADYHKAVQTPSADFDRLFFKVEKSAEGITGLIESLDDKEIKFEVEGKMVTQSREKLIGIVMAQAIVGEELPSATLNLASGGSIGGELTAIADDKVFVKLGGEELSIPWKSVRSIAVRSSKMAFLSDLKPTAAEQQSIVTLTRPWQRDRSYSGKPLQLGQRTFEKGIGAHSRSQLTFALGGKFDDFAAVVGIDTATEGKGDCVMSVLADGKPLWTSRVKGSDPPRDLNLKVAGVQELTLVVDPGEELDLADHANWADARVIRSSK